MTVIRGFVIHILHVAMLIQFVINTHRSVKHNCQDMVHKTHIIYFTIHKDENKTKC